MPSRRLPTDDEREVGRRLREIRKRRGLSPMQVAIALGTTQTNYEFYEQGRNKLRAEQVRDFADALGIEPWKLLDVLYPLERTRETSSSFNLWPGRGLVTAGQY